MESSPKVRLYTIAAAALLFTMITACVFESDDDNLPKTYEEKRIAAIVEKCGSLAPLAAKKLRRDWFDSAHLSHRNWLREYDTTKKQGTRQAYEDIRRADLCGANLADFTHSNLDLRGATLIFVDFRNATLWNAKFQNAQFGALILNFGPNQSNYIAGANLSGASLVGADFSGANLVGVNLSGTDLDRVVMEGTYLAQANLGGANFQLLQLPPVESISRARNRELMYFNNNPEALIKLRKAFDDAGHRQAAREITYAIKRSEYRAKPAKYLNASVFEILKIETAGATSNPTVVWQIIEDAFRYVFFDLPTQWGMNPGRAIRVLLIAIFVFLMPYAFAFRYPSGGRIYRRWGADQPLTGSKRSRGKRIYQPTESRTGVEPLQYAWPKAIGRGLQFSFISAFHIGWRELNVGNWISRLQPRDYTLFATGWVRTVAGIQSLISVYLLAMWALTYFGRPFD